MKNTQVNIFITKRIGNTTGHFVPSDQGTVRSSGVIFLSPFRIWQKILNHRRLNRDSIEEAASKGCHTPMEFVIVDSR